jgi:hypothetical protein
MTNEKCYLLIPDKEKDQSCVKVYGLCGCSSRSCLNYSMDVTANLPFAGKIKRNTGKEMGQKVLSA